MPALLMTGADLNGQRAQNLGDGSNPTDAVTLQQLQNYLAGLAWKQPVRVASTTNGALASAYANGQTVDGVTLATGMRILLKDQSTASENGIYVVAASGAPTRATDADSLAELQNAAVYVIAGTANADKNFVQTANDVTPGTTSQTWVQQGIGQSYTQGNGISISGTVITAVAKASAGLTVDSGGIGVDRGRTPQFYAQALAAASANSPQTVTHSLGTKRVDVTIVRNSDGQDVTMDVKRDTVNTVQVTSGTAMAAGDYDIVLMG